jgi:hypothetical protein
MNALETTNLIAIIALSTGIVTAIWQIRLEIISKRYGTSIKVLRERIRRLESFERNYYRDRGPLSTTNIGAVEYELQKSIEGNKRLQTELAESEALLKEKSAKLYEEQRKIVGLNSHISLLESSLKQADNLLRENNIGRISFMGFDFSNRPDLSTASLLEKGEIIGAEAVEPFVQEGGEIEGFNSQAIRERKSHKIPNPDEVFEMLAEIEDKEPKIDKPLIDCEFVTYETERKVKLRCDYCKGAKKVRKPFTEGGVIDCPECKGEGYVDAERPKIDFKPTPTQCRECGNELWLRDEDAGSDKEVSRLCDECFNAENSLCGKCGKQDELYRCEGGCNTEICSDCQATYDQFSQIDYSCCQDCADSNRER